MSNEWPVNGCACPVALYRLWHAGIAGPEVEDQDGHQDEDRAEQRVEQELDGRVLAVGAAPDADQEVHRQEHHLEEHVEEEEVERDEDPHHARHQQQEECVVALDLLGDVPRGEAGQHADQSGQDHQAQTDAVQSQVILDVEIGNPGPPHDQVALACGLIGDGQGPRAVVLKHVVDDAILERCT